MHTLYCEMPEGGAVLRFATLDAAARQARDMTRHYPDAYICVTDANSGDTPYVHIPRRDDERPSMLRDDLRFATGEVMI